MAKPAARTEHPEFESMSDTQLREMIEHARGTLRERITSRLDEFKALAREAGFSVTFEKLEEGDGRRRRRSSQEGSAGPRERRGVPAKYRNPDNSSETWSGRGHRPRWLLQQLEKGRAMSDLLIGGDGSQQGGEAAA